jgi:hypothetical protein
VADQGVDEEPRAQRESARRDNRALGAVKKTRGDLAAERGRMISLEDRQGIIQHVKEAHCGGGRLKCLCAGAGISSYTLQRWRRRDALVRGDERSKSGRPGVSHTLTWREAEQVLQVADEGRFAKSRPAHIVSTLADEGVYFGSDLSLSRVPRARTNPAARVRQGAQRARPPSTHMASGLRYVRY